jgi:SNF2 family DNA or RNA helicase
MSTSTRLYVAPAPSFDSLVLTGLQMPDDLSVKLLKHQVQGVQWMKSREKGKKRGGILADDVSWYSLIDIHCILTSTF